MPINIMIVPILNLKICSEVYELFFVTHIQEQYSKIQQHHFVRFGCIGTELKSLYILSKYLPESR